MQSRGIWGFILRRVLLGLLVLVIVVGAGVRGHAGAAGDPARAILGRDATPASLAALRAKLHLDQPVLQQYWTWVTGLLHGDMGNSLANQEPVSTYLRPLLINSAFLVFLSGIISIPLAIGIGAYAAVRRDKAFDVSSSILTLLLAALPEFVVGVGLVVIFATVVVSGAAGGGPDPSGWPSLG